MRRPPSATRMLVLALAALAGACGGGGPTTPVGGANGDDEGIAVKADPSFAADIMSVFSRNSCMSSGCHGTGEAGLFLTGAATSYANLVNVPSTQTGELRVIPGNPADSYLVKKLEGRQGVGARMPLGLGPVSATDLTNVRNWIAQGAKNN